MSVSFHAALVAGFAALGCNALVLACACAPPGSTSGNSVPRPSSDSAAELDPGPGSELLRPGSAHGGSPSPSPSSSRPPSAPRLANCHLARNPAGALVQSRLRPGAAREAAALRRSILDDASLIRESWVDDEDASSGFHTLVLRDGARRRLVRVVWNGGSQQLVSVTDYLFDEAGRLSHVEENLVAERELKVVVSGSPARRATRVASWQFRSGRLTAWSELHVAPLMHCDQWLEKERQLLESAAVARS